MVRQLDLFEWASSSSGDAPQGARVIIPYPFGKRPRLSKIALGQCLPPVVRPFPQDRRTSKVLDVATKLLAKTTSRAIDHYRNQVSEAMAVHLRSRHVPADQHAGQIRRFWVAVDCEVARRIKGRQRPGGAA